MRTNCTPEFATYHLNLAIVKISTKKILKAIEDGNTDAVRKMLTRQPSLVNQADEHGFTPLMLAVSSADRTPELVQALIDAGADVNAKTGEGYTALHMMADVNGPTGHGAMPGHLARILVAAGGELEAKQHWGWTPLMRAAVEGTVDELQALAEVGARLDHLFPGYTLSAFLDGRTTLMAAIGFPEKVRVLIEAGADLLAVDAHGQTALEYARKSLSEAEARKAAAPPCAAEISAKTLESTVEALRKAGLDPDEPVPFDESGMTYRQSLEQSLRKMAANIAKFDYCGEVRKSIALIESAMKKE